MAAPHSRHCGRRRARHAFRPNECEARAHGAVAAPEQLQNDRRAVDALGAVAAPYALERPCGGGAALHSTGASATPDALRNARGLAAAATQLVRADVALNRASRRAHARAQSLRALQPPRSAK
jgi:hypothetical protein